MRGRDEEPPIDVGVTPADELAGFDELAELDKLAATDELARLDGLTAADELAKEDEVAMIVEPAEADELALADDLPVCANEELATVEDKTAALYKFILEEPPQYSVAFAKHASRSLDGISG